jgi:hypothetical protein
MTTATAISDFASIRVGDMVPRKIWTATRENMQAFGELIPARPDNPGRSRNPHLDEEYARSQIFGGLFADGNHIVSLVCQTATDWLPRNGLVSGHSEVDMRFPNPCRLGDTLTISGEVIEKRCVDGRDFVVLKMLAENQTGKAVAVGTIAAYVPR